MNRWLKLLLGFGVTGVCLWWTFKDTRWTEMWAALTSANWLVLLPWVGISLIIHLCRVWRWGNLLSGLEKVPFKKLNEASAIGFMMLILLPFRLGEFARPFLIAQRSGIRRSAAMTSVVLERIVDGMAMAIVLRVLVIFLPEGAPNIVAIRLAANVMFLIFSGGLTFLLLARWQHDRVVGLMRAVGNRVSSKLTERAVTIVDGFVGALRQLPDGRNMAMFFLLTVIYWGLNGLGMVVVASGFDCSRGANAACAPMSLNLFQGFVVLGALIVGMMIPAAPGSAGTFQSSVMIALGAFLPMSVVNSSGVAYANALWVLQIVQQIATGLLFLGLSNTTFSDVTGKLREDQKSGESA